MGDAFMNPGRHPRLMTSQPSILARVAATAIALLLGGALVASGPADASPTAVSNARLRVGTVQSSPAPQADYIWVAVDGTVVPAAYFTGYVPIPGDRVIVTQDGTDWFVLGGKSGFAGNLVLNPDFSVNPRMQITADLPPWNWYHHRASGPATSIVIAGINPVTSEPVMAMILNSALASDNYAYSAAFPVTPGQAYSVNAGVEVQSSGATLTVTLRVAWLAAPADAYPTFLSETVIESIDTSLGNNAGWLGSATTATAPAGATYARVAIRSQMAAGGLSMYTGVGFVSARPV